MMNKRVFGSFAVVLIGYITGCAKTKPVDLDERWLDPEGLEWTFVSYSSPQRRRAQYQGAVSAEADGYWMVMNVSHPLDGFGLHDNDTVKLLRIDPSGQVRWSKIIGSSQQDIARSICGDGEGGVLVAGYTRGRRLNIEPEGVYGEDADAFLASIDETGRLNWVRRFAAGRREQSVVVKVY